MITISKKLNILILEDIPIDAELVRCELEKADISFSIKGGVEETETGLSRSSTNSCLT